MINLNKKKYNIKTPKKMLEGKDIQSIKGLYYIANLNNLENILRSGKILSHNKVKRKKLYSKTNDISNQSVQNVRAQKTFSSPRSKKSKKLHNYVNFYLQAFNGMIATISRTIEDQNKLCVIKIHQRLLEDRWADCVLTTKNAAAKNARFLSPSGWHLSKEDASVLYSKRLSGLDEHRIVSSFKFRNNMQIRQAEALFKEEVPIQYIDRIYAPNETTQSLLRSIIKKQSLDIKVIVYPSMFPTPKKRQMFKQTKECSPLIPIEDNSFLKKRLFSTIDPLDRLINKNPTNSPLAKTFFHHTPEKRPKAVNAINSPLVPQKLSF